LPEGAARVKLMSEFSTYETAGSLG
jgi:hypothetical protein